MKHKKLPSEKMLTTTEHFTKFLWVALLGLLIWAMTLGGCATQKDGCGTYHNWISKHKTFNK